ncbi:hypothetical protein [Streptomyces sp. NPDC007905]|uniref:hypothetical protein n=1 Tax=Streptomyces sp. NPDC007905 TaxID=3364788 RepID=UPI0036F05BF3
MIDLEVRVEFYERVGPVGEPSEGYLGALEQTEGYRASAVPEVGTFLSRCFSTRFLGPRPAVRERVIFVPELSVHAAGT